MKVIDKKSKERYVEFYYSLRKTTIQNYVKKLRIWLKIDNS